MKLLNRLRELRDEHQNRAHEHTDDIDYQHLDTIGVGTTTIDDIIRLNLEHRNLQMSSL